MTKSFLSVDCSLTGFRWRDRLRGSDERLAVAISQRYDLPEILGRVLAARGVKPDICREFLEPRIRSSLPDPSVLRDMDVAAERIVRAIINGEKIAIFGDYDVDGATSCALFSRFLTMLGRESRVYIPDRIREGYGPNADAFQRLADEGATLIICLDCGSISSPAFEVKSGGTSPDIIVFDHHQTQSGELPAVYALVNPSRHDDLSGLHYLCAVGVTFLALVAVTRFLRNRSWFENGKRPEPSLFSLLDLVALGTVCDLVPLIDLNRAFVAQGLAVMRESSNIGLAALAKTSRLSAPVDSQTLGFMFGPRINAGGRIGQADLGVRLLCSEDSVESAEIAARLEQLNQERKNIERRICDEVILATEANIDPASPSRFLIVSGNDWHPGVVGLVATRVKDHFRRASIAISFNRSGLGIGSGRSIPGIDLGRIIRAALDEGLLVKGGGHAMAAGLTIEKSKLPDFSAFMDDILGSFSAVILESGIDDLLLDGVLTAGGAQAELVALLGKAGPFGVGHPEPCFAFPNHFVRDARIMGEDHVRCNLFAGNGASIGAVAFRSASKTIGRFLLDRPQIPVHVAGFVTIDQWGGRRRPQLHIVDIADPRQNS